MHKHINIYTKRERERERERNIDVTVKRHVDKRQEALLQLRFPIGWAQTKLVS